MPISQKQKIKKRKKLTDMVDQPRKQHQPTAAEHGQQSPKGLVNALAFPSPIGIFSSKTPSIPSRRSQRSSVEAAAQGLHTEHAKSATELAERPLPARASSKASGGGHLRTVQNLQQVGGLHRQTSDGQQ